MMRKQDLMASPVRRSLMKTRSSACENTLRSFSGMDSTRCEMIRKCWRKGGPTDLQSTESYLLSPLSHAQICAGHGSRRQNLTMSKEIAQKAVFGSAQAMEGMVLRWAWEVVNY